MGHWLVLSYRVPTEPSRKRVYVWRRVKELGAVYLQQGVAALPDREHLRTQLEQLREEINGMSGEAMLMTCSIDNEADEGKLIGSFHALRTQDYGEIIEKCELLIAELEEETKVGKFTFAEVEENEAELGKISRWLEKVAERDHLDCPTRSQAEEALARATERATKYAEEVYDREI